MKKPYVSVLLICHERTRFIVEAVNSVLHQSLDSSLFEIVVVKKFVDTNIDCFLQQNGVRVINTIEDFEGAKISIGVNVCRGSVVCLLEDDDTFVADKLATIYTYFSRLPDLVLYHNDFNLIDINGRLLEDQTITGKHPVAPLQLTLTQYSDRILSLNQFMYRLGNASSISVRKDILVDLDVCLRDLKQSPDAFLFFSILKINGIVISDVARLTNWRIHFGSMIGKSRMSLEEFKSHRILSHSQIVHDLDMLSDILSRRDTEWLFDGFSAMFRLGFVRDHCEQVNPFAEDIRTLLKALRLFFSFSGRRETASRICIGLGIVLFPKLAWHFLYTKHLKFTQMLSSIGDG
ncbi:MAG: glycosyltransferase [Nitrososphaerota archaeon]|nr:glycosyltransferase [Nitrososphaerota archaeon]